MTETNEMRVFSFGGGWQSVAVLALQALGKLPKPYDAFVFASVGYESEPETHDYFTNVAMPFAEEFGIRLEMTWKERAGEQHHLIDAVMTEERLGIPIPIWMPGQRLSRRACTSDWKIEVVNRWIKTQGVSHATVGIGISMDEQTRCDPARMEWHSEYAGRNLGFTRRYDYPLIDLQMWRDQLVNVYAEAGIPTPPKSACFYCPFSSRSRWIELKRNHPERFQKAVEMQRVINRKRAHLERGGFWLHVDGDLETAVSDQLPLWDLETGDGDCSSGYCFT